MKNNFTVHDFDKLYHEVEDNQEEYLDALLDGIKKSAGYPELLKCIYENFYIEKGGINKVSSFTDEELAEGLIQLKENCAERNDIEIPPFLELLENLMTRPDFGVAVRWAISRLVGLSVLHHYRHENAA